MFFDSHCHLDLAPLGADLDAVLDRAVQAGVSRILIPSVSREKWKDVEASCQFPHPIRRYIALGMHPCFMKYHKDQADLDALESQLQSSNDVIAVGECGLDLFIDNPQEERQKALFKAQLDLALAYKRPVIIHSRRSLDQVIKMLRHTRPDRGGVVHAFSGSEQQAKQLWDLGIRLGIGGTLTYERAQRLARVVKAMPLTSLLLETDAPDMPLFGFQGTANEPAQVARVAQAVARLRNQSLQEIALQTTENAQSLFLQRSA